MSDKRKTIFGEFPELLRSVEDDHVKMKAIGNGHDFLHAFIVAQYAAIIAEDDAIARLGWVAGILHNTDRMFPEKEVRERVQSHLDTCTNLDSKEKPLVFEAVMNHDKLNDPADNPVTVTLKDADRLANIGAQLFIRDGQHNNNLPAVDPNHTFSNPDPEATYRNPKTSYQGIMYALEWEDMLRLPRAREMSRKRFELMRTCLKDIEDQLIEVGLHPYPLSP